MTLPLLLLLDVLAAYRLTRLVVADTFPPVAALRDRIVTKHTTIKPAPAPQTGHVEEPDAWAELVQCPWCCGFWCSLIVAAAHWCAFGLPAPAFVVPALALALSAAVGIVSQLVDG